MMVQVNREDLVTLLMTTVRYSMTRMTFLSILVPDLVRRYSQHFTGSERFHLRQEIENELSNAEAHKEYVGHPADHRRWRQLVEEMKKE